MASTPEPAPVANPSEPSVRANKPDPAAVAIAEDHPAPPELPQDAALEPPHSDDGSMAIATDEPATGDSSAATPSAPMNGGSLEVAQTPDKQPEPALIARIPTPATPSPVVNPALDTPRDVLYPDTGLPVGRSPVPEPEMPGTTASSLPPQRQMGFGGPCWQAPETLLARLDNLARYELTRGWAVETAQLVRRLGVLLTDKPEETAGILDRLDQLNRENAAVVETIHTRSLAQEASRTGHALTRRLELWKQLVHIDPAVAAREVPAIDPQSIPMCLQALDTLTRDSSEGRAWRNYLLVDALQQWANQRIAADERVPREVAQQLVKRIGQTPMTPSQRQFLSHGPAAALQRELARHAAEPVDSGRLLKDLERYERTGLPSDGRKLAEDCQYLTLAPSEAGRKLAADLDAHYRNANVRVAISAEFLNRLVPKRLPEVAPVRDHVLGLPVQGESVTSSNVAVRLLPNPDRVRLALEVTGQVAAATSSNAGPATLFSDSDAVYIAQKPMEVDLNGIRLGPTEIEVQNNSHLRGIRTDFDRVPLVGPIVRGVVRSQHDQKLPAAEAEVREKMAATAQERIDNEAKTQLDETARRLQRDVLGPLNALALDPTLIAGETTERRFIMRVRLAGKDQLGSHTPRPQAPADSLASVQVHETAINNFVQRLELDGRTFTLPELDKHIADRLGRPLGKPVSADREDVTIGFAEKDAVRVRCVEGRLEITLAITKLAKGARHWKDFQVRAYYRPDLRGRSVELVRDGVIQLIGRIPTGGQIALRGVFSKTFSQKAPWNLMPERLANDPKLKDVAITQLTIEDGWLGVALGTQRTAQRTPLLRR